MCPPQHTLARPLIQALYTRCMMPVRLRCFAQHTAGPARLTVHVICEGLRVHAGEFWPAPADRPSREGRTREKSMADVRHDLAGL